MSEQPTRQTITALLGAALFLWSADATAHVATPARVPMTPPWWWTQQGVEPDLLALLPPAPLDLLSLSDREERERWYDGEAETDGEDQVTEINLPCGVFLDGEPRLTLFDDASWWEPPAAAVVAAWHTDKQGVIVEYDQIPRRWDRPLDYDAYRYPVAGAGYPRWQTVTSGYDLDLPDAEQRRGTMHAVGHGGFDLPQARGTKVTLLPLAQQLGDATVVHVGALFGNSVVTLHAVREGGERRSYLLIFGHLESAAPGLAPGQVLPAGSVLGFVGSSESDFVHLHLEVRRVRDGVDPATLTGSRVLARDATIVTDPRNVLPTRPARSPSCKERRLAQRRAALFQDLRLSLDPLAR